MPNVLERNWWESNEHIEEQRAIAEEAIRLDEERRMKEEQDAEMGEEPEEVEEPQREKMQAGKNGNGAQADKVVARTRVSCLLRCEVDVCVEDSLWSQLQFKPEEVQELRTLGLPSRVFESRPRATARSS